MNFGVTTKLIATAFALCGFAVAIIAGLGAGNAPGGVLSTAIVSMIACQVAGLAVGAIGERVVHEHLETYRNKHAVPGAGGEAATAAGKSSPPEAQNS